MKMAKQDTQTFDLSSTPEALKAIFQDNAENFAVSVTVEDVLTHLHGDAGLIVEAAFIEARSNGDADILLQQQADALMYIGYELHRCLLLWRSLHEGGGATDAGEHRSKPTIGVVALLGGELKLLNDFDGVAQPIRLLQQKEARQFIRALRDL
jgi:hypothetical protein